MTWMRHAGRHVQHTVLNHVAARMTDLGWMGPEGEVPFGAVAMRMVDQPVVSSDRLVDTVLVGDQRIKIGPGVIACTLGTELPSEMDELGGPLSVQEYPIFFDVFQDSYAAALSAATDVRDILMGRLADCPRSLPLVNQINGQEVAGWRLEFEDIERTAPEHRFPLHWQVVKVTASAYFPEVVY